MKTRTIVILCVGGALCFGCLICGGLVASYLTSQLIAQKNKRVVLVVAKLDYPKGTIITDPEQMFELREILESDAPPGILTDLEDLQDQTLTNDIRKGEPVQHHYLEETKLEPP